LHRVWLTGENIVTCILYNVIYTTFGTDLSHIVLRQFPDGTLEWMAYPLQQCKKWRAILAS